MFIYCFIAIIIIIIALIFGIIVLVFRRRAQNDSKLQNAESHFKNSDSIKVIQQIDINNQKATANAISAVLAAQAQAQAQIQNLQNNASIKSGLTSPGTVISNIGGASSIAGSIKSGGTGVSRETNSTVISSQQHLHSQSQSQNSHKNQRRISQNHSQNIQTSSNYAESNSTENSSLGTSRTPSHISMNSDNRPIVAKVKQDSYYKLQGHNNNLINAYSTIKNDLKNHQK
jgi:type III secretory pathway component EscV